MDAIEVLKTRRCVRVFNEEPVATEILEDLIDCGRLAATARNDQPWEFVIVTDAATRARLAELTDYGKFIAQAPACIVVLCRETKYYLEDGSAAAQNILLAARAHRLGACWVAGDKKAYAEKVCALVGAPPKYRLICLIAVGQSAESPQPAKRSLDEVLHWNRF